MKPTLRLCAAPRSVSDATRFTANTLHASSKAATPPPRFSHPKSGSVPPGPAGAGAGGPGRGGNAGPSHLAETPEQKIARLRAAHRRAKEAQVSRFDRIVDASRRVFDSAHKITVAGLFGFTVLAGLVTAYTAFDMIMYNKKRGAEWAEAQKKLEADSLEAARVAYMTGKATDEQIALVEEQLERERESGRKTSFFTNMPSVLDTSDSSNPSSPPPPQSVTETVSWPTQTPTTATQPDQSQPAEQPKPANAGLWSWLTSNLKREEEDSGPGPTRPMSSERRLGWESLSEEDDGAGVRESDLVRAVDDRQAARALLREKAAAALEREKENQRAGGPLDRVGMDGADRGVKAVPKEEEQEAEQGKKAGKKGWLW